MYGWYDMLNSRQGCLTVGYGIWHLVDKVSTTTIFYKAPTGIIIKSNIKIMMWLVFVLYLNKFRTTFTPWEGNRFANPENEQEINISKWKLKGRHVSWERLKSALFDYELPSCMFNGVRRSLRFKWIKYVKIVWFPFKITFRWFLGEL